MLVKTLWIKHIINIEVNLLVICILRVWSVHGRWDILKGYSRFWVHRKNIRWYHCISSQRFDINDWYHCSGKVNPTDSRKNFSWKADNSSASREISRILWNPKNHHCVRQHMPFIRILGQMNPVRALLPYYVKIHSNTIQISSTLTSPRSLSFVFPSDPAGISPPRCEPNGLPASCSCTWSSEHYLAN